MRLLCELVVIIGLIALGWQKPFHEWASDLATKSSHVTPAKRKNATLTGRQPFLDHTKANPSATP